MFLQNYRGKPRKRLKKKKNKRYNIANKNRRPIVAKSCDSEIHSISIYNYSKGIFFLYTKDVCVSFLASFHCLAMFFFFFPKNVYYKFSYIIILNVLLKTYSSIYKLYIRNAYQNILVSIFI